MDEELLQKLYTWIDEIPLSRQKRNVTRDFSDGVLLAEIVQNYLPKLVELHNYTPASSTAQKRNNWNTLNNKVLKKIGLTVPDSVIMGIVTNKPGVIEIVLNNVKLKIERALTKKKMKSQQDAMMQAVTQQQQHQQQQHYNQHHHNQQQRQPQQQQQQQQHAMISGSYDNYNQQGALPPLNNNGMGAYVQQPQQDSRQQYMANYMQPANNNRAAEVRQPEQEDIRDRQLQEYKEAVEILQTKVQKLEQLVKLKERRIDDLSRRLQPV